MEPQDKREFYKVSDIALKLGVTKETVREWLNREENPLPYYEISKREYFIRITDFEQWLESQKKM